VDPRSPSLADSRLAALTEQACASFHAARAPATLRAYRHDWRRFAAWCAGSGVSALPAVPETVVLYTTDLAKNEGRRWNTVARRLAAISQQHQEAGFPSPVRTWLVRQFLAGLRREIGVASRHKQPLLVEDLRLLFQAGTKSMADVRDRALLLLGFAGAFRRSELVALNVDDLRASPAGLLVSVRRGKTDQEGEGREVGIPFGTEESTCPIRAIQAWRQAANLESGSLFRRVDRQGRVQPGRLSAESVALIVQRRVGQLGYDAAQYAGHSLRAGLATSAAAAGKSERSIMQQTGHRSLATLRRYIRDGDRFRDNAVSGIGL
jgi:site-specific recombinase XerD